jgi:hypothetical protein
MPNGTTGTESDRAAWTRASAQHAPHAVYVTGEDQLRLTVLNALASVRVVVRGRFQDLDGRVRPFDTSLVPATDRTASTVTVRLGEGWLLNAHVFVSSASPLTGQTFAMLSLIRGEGTAAIDVATLAAGPITAVQRIAYPGSPIANSLTGAGAARSITGTDPAAGAEVSETVPTGARWRLLAFNVVLVTSAVAGNREVVLTLDDGVTNISEVAAGVAQPASVTRRYSFSRGVARFAPAASTVIAAPAPDILLFGGSRIRTVTTALDVGDNFGAPQLSVEEFIEGA